MIVKLKLRFEDEDDYEVEVVVDAGSSSLGETLRRRRENLVALFQN